VQLVDVEIALEEEVAVFILEICEAAGGAVVVALANRGLSDSDFSDLNGLICGRRKAKSPLSSTERASAYN
jgi:hypothetical protein